MILLNFNRKMDAINFEMFQQMTGYKITEQIMLPLEYSTLQGFIVELEKSFDRLKVTDAELNQDRIVINPSNNLYAMSILEAYLLHRTGKLPLLIVQRASMFGLSNRLEINEVIDLQEWADKDR